MREISRFTDNNKLAIIKSNGGAYLIELYIDDNLIETKLFDEHTLRIVENYGKNWFKEH